MNITLKVVMGYELYDRDVALLLWEALERSPHILVKRTYTTRRPSAGGGNGNGGSTTYVAHIVLISLLSAGGLTALAKILSTFMQRHKDNSIWLETPKGRVYIRGHSYRKLELLLRKLHFLTSKKSPRKCPRSSTKRS